jgi:[ribosomal protein S18]-alanine N-acetyltransferase
MPVTIRSAARDDVAAILAIERQAANAAHWSHQQYEGRLTDGIVLVAEEEMGSLSGFVCARAVAGEWEIENVVVAESVRRHGVADGLLTEIMRRARAQAASAVWLEVRESNQPARFLYEKHGFHETGRRRMYYRNPDEDAVLYALDLSLSRLN